MSSLFISDLHLSPENTQLTALACHFLRQHVDAVSDIYILGDIFNTWLGDDIVPKEFSEFIAILSSYTANGGNLYLMVGNRDFMLGNAFAKSVGASLIKDGYKLTLAGQPALLMHGDSLCVDDVSYQRYRKVVNQRWLQWCFLKLPVSYRQKISDQIKQKSREKKQYKTSQIMDVNDVEVDNVFQQEQIRLLIHGHTHRPAVHQLAEDHYRIVLGDWRDAPSYLLVDDGHMHLQDPRLPDSKKSLRFS
ncbi:hypothetical protein LCGC14_0512630 [marine sediment metagenome]|uniref:Calcineurin-like phosphoesterase domain-containing protein n=1 Tax=marine sediment metagenome TaxID=412755 RepID=A0A0F9UMC9_9ZZZZ